MNAGDVPEESESDLPRRVEAAEIRVREATPDDLAFIFSGWLRSFRVGDLCAGVGNDRYFEAHHRVIVALLERATVLVACDAEAPNVLLGFACASVLPGGTRLMHYLYVKEEFRRNGICDMMLAGLDEIEPTRQTVATHRTRRGKLLCRAKGWGYDPYALMALLPPGWDRTAEHRPLLPERVRRGRSA